MQKALHRRRLSNSPELKIYPLLATGIIKKLTVPPHETGKMEGEEPS